MIAFWISPGGKIINVGVTHIHEIIRYPRKFGFDKEHIKKIYRENDEKIGTEGVARRKILLFLIDKGWIRIRKYGDKYWSINVKKISDKSKTYLRKWAGRMLEGISGFKENDPYIPVKIDQKDSKTKILSMLTIAKSDEFITKNFQKYEIVFTKTEELDDILMC